MPMRIIRAFPPNYPVLRRVFGLAGKTDVIYSFGDTIYSPGGTKLHPALIAHEEAHGARQREMGVELWWRRYIDDPQFRLAEEVIGHQAEWKWWRENGKNNLTRQLEHICRRLCGPLYLGLITYEQAVEFVDV